MSLGRVGQVIDLDKFVDRLRGMAYTARTTVLTKAVREGGKLIQEEMERLAPRDKGKLRANIGLSVVQPTATQAIARIGPAKKAFYGKFPDLGTKFQDPYPYVRRAFDARLDEAFAVSLYILNQGLEKRGF